MGGLPKRAKIPCLRMGKKRGRRGEERKRERRKRRRKRRRDPSEVIKIHFLFLIVVTLLITIIIN